MNAKQLQVVAWSLSLVVSALAFMAWGQGLDWELESLSNYQLFPLFGLLAFSLMWAHYIAAALRQYSGLEASALHSYFEVTSLFVLAFILLHPGLLAWQLWRDGFGLPPGSAKIYVGSALYIWIWAGITAWVAFMAYELRRKFKNRPWWKYVSYASDIAMLLIFFHALKLGSQLDEGWFRTVWYFYGLSLVGAIIYIHFLAPKPDKSLVKS